MSKWQENSDIQIFREYLKIASVHPNVDYDPCVDFLKKQAENLGLPVSLHYPAHEKCPVVVMTWIGANPNLPSIMLNSHMDVVPVDASNWTHPPFAANIDDDGRIFARGSQDMKCTGMQYLSAIRILREQGKVLQRTIHITFVPDEEIGSKNGMKSFVTSDAFSALNVGFYLDESCASPSSTLPVFYAERSQFALELICEGTSGHGCLIHENTAGEKVCYLMNKFFEMRTIEADKLKNNPNLGIGDVTAVNLTMLKGGLQTNVVPNKMSLTWDIRLSIDVDHVAFEKQINQWCTEAGGDVTINVLLKDPKTSPTKTDQTNPFWVAFEDATKELNLDIKKMVCPGSTDARFIRALNIPALGFMPMPNTPLRLHGNDEFIHADVYLNGIQIYKQIIANLGNA